MKFTKLLIGLLLTSICVSSEKKHEDYIMSCFKSDCLDKKTTWQHLANDLPTCLKATKVWWSGKMAQLPVTLVTQLSADRLKQLRAQCMAWKGPLAAALHLPLIAGAQLSSENHFKIQAAAAAIDQLFKEMETEGSCQLRIALLYEAVANERASTLYPVNTLRNVARLLADTEAMANIDVDMLPSVSLSTDLSNAGNAKLYVDRCKEKQVYVIPAFETLCGGPSFADRISTMSKRELGPHIQDECLSQFRARVAPACHNATDFARWFSAESAYSIQYQESFEPWVISDRMDTPWYDVRYKGYGKNKIVQVAHMAKSGFTFNVHPTGFLVHRPHPESLARKSFLRVKFKSKNNPALLKDSLYQHIEDLWAQHNASLVSGMYKVMVDDALTECVKSLPWWKPSRH